MFFSRCAEAPSLVWHNSRPHLARIECARYGRAIWRPARGSIRREIYACLGEKCCVAGASAWKAFSWRWVRFSSGTTGSSLLRANNRPD
jgi:hypothetical protein